MAIKDHKNDVIFSYESLEEFIALIQRQGINNIKIFSVDALLHSATNSPYHYSQVKVRNSTLTEFTLEELEEHYGYDVIIKYNVPYNSDTSNNNKNNIDSSRHIFIRVGDIVKLETGPSDMGIGTLTLTLNNSTANGIIVQGFDGHGHVTHNLISGTWDSNADTAIPAYNQLGTNDYPWDQLFVSQIIPVTNTTHNVSMLGNSSQLWDKAYIDEAHITNLNVGGADITNIIPKTNGKNYEFWRGDGTWSNVLLNDSTTINPYVTFQNAVFNKGDTNQSGSPIPFGSIYFAGTNYDSTSAIHSSFVKLTSYVSENNTPTFAINVMENEANSSQCCELKIVYDKQGETTPTSFSTFKKRMRFDGGFEATKVYNAVFNDYAEFRSTIDLEPGRCVIDNDDGTLSCAEYRLIPGAQIISDTFGHSMGETDTAKTPIAVAGRVLVYPYQSRENYHSGMAVCSAPEGTVDIMTREEIKEYPDCIVGIVSEIPDYETWGTDNVKVNGRIWIKVR